MNVTINLGLFSSEDFKTEAAALKVLAEALDMIGQGRSPQEAKLAPVAPVAAPDDDDEDKAAMLSERAKKAAATKAKNKAAKEAAKVKPLEFADVRKVVGEVSLKHGREAVEELLVPYEAARISAVPQESWGDLIEAALVRLDAADE